jgi:hypothetical protein
MTDIASLINWLFFCFVAVKNLFNIKNKAAAPQIGGAASLFEKSLRYQGPYNFLALYVVCNRTCALCPLGSPKNSSLHLIFVLPAI